MVVTELDGWVDCCGDGVERKWIFVDSGPVLVVSDSEFGEVEMVDWGGWLWYDFVDFSGRIGDVLAVELSDFCLERSHCCLGLDLTRECRESFSIDKTLEGRE